MITEYHRPTTLAEAVELAGHPDARVMVEGTALTSAIYIGSTAVIDLQALDLDGIEMQGESLRIGSMATLADLSTSPLVPPIIAELAQREAPNTIRNTATVGGVVAANDPESELLAGLVAFDASVTVAGVDATQVHPLDAVIESPQLIEAEVIVEVSMGPRGVAAAHRTARTPMDRPIVMVVGHRDSDGHIRLGVTGVDTHVVGMSPGQTDALNPPSDFRGTSQYRRTLAAVLTKRVLTDLSGGVTG